MQIILKRKKYFENSIALLLIVLLGLVIYFNSFQNKMFWDDDDIILKNQFTQNLKYFPKYFSENLIAGANLTSNYWRPLVLITFALEWQLWQNWEVGYHLVNTLFHIANAILTFFLILLLFKNQIIALFSSLIFLVHPLQTEAVTYVSGLADPLATFFILLGLISYIKFRFSPKSLNQKIYYLLSLLSFIFALLSKEIAIIMPALVVLVDFFLPPKTKSFREKIKNLLKTIAPFLLIIIIYALLRIFVLNFKNTSYFQNEISPAPNILTKFLTFFKILTIYFGLFFAPFNLHMERKIETFNYLSPSLIIGIVIFLLLITLLFYFRKITPLVFGIIWFFIGLTRASGLIIPLNGFLYEHWLYISQIGIALILISLGIIISKDKKYLQGILIAIFIAFIIFLSFLTIKRNEGWKDPITFYTQTLKYAPFSYRVINNLGMAYADQGNLEEATKYYKKAISLDPQNPVAYHNLGNVYLKKGELNLAIDSFQKAISLDPKFIFSYSPLINIYYMQGKNKESQELLKNIKEK
jgi:tetratricopeptide (TPR) repeat protein